MKTIETRIKQLEDKLMLSTDKSNKRLSIRIFDEKYINLFTNAYLNEHYPGYKDYLTLYLPDNGRVKNKEPRPYVLEEL
ncbi:MAG TPA: hypothetical protein VGD14_01355 [bacterium]